jgi:hypothetical protein
MGVPSPVGSGSRGMYLDPRQVPMTLMQPAMDAGRPVAPPAAFTALTISCDPKSGRPRSVDLNREDGCVEVYLITDYSGVALGPDVRYYELGSRVITDPPPSGLDRVAAAVKAARGGDAPAQIQGYA